MTRAFALTRPGPTAANERLADDIGENLAGQQHEDQVVSRILSALGDGDELGRAIDAMQGRSSAFRMGFFRRLQRRLEQGAAG